jgi:serine/threonine protein kinase
MTVPSDLQLGQIIDGWRVDKQIEVFQGQTGGFFSRGYFVSKNGQPAFLKAMDLSKVMHQQLEVILATINQYVFEGNLFKLCAENGLSHIVRMLSQGEFIPDQYKHLPNAQFYRVFYIIFELASEGDIRRELKYDGVKTCSWRMHVLHQIAVAIKQLHSVGIAHQDVKPSNVLGFKDQKKYKLSDLGRSISRNHPSSLDKIGFPGDLNYAPLEYFYGHTPTEYQDQRNGSDIYLLGSMLSFLYVGMGALTYTLGYLPQNYWHNNWTGSYTEVLPYLIDAHTKATENLAEQLDGNPYQKEIATIYFQLCHPDPAVRGNPKTRKTGAGLGLDRYITDFDRFSKGLAIQERIRRTKNVA